MRTRHPGTVTQARTLSGVDDRPAAQAARTPGRHRSARFLPRAATGSTCGVCASMCRPISEDFLFDPGLVDTKVGILSGGETYRGCCWRASSPAPPTCWCWMNRPIDLDLETLDLLQEVIADFDGTVLIVSHDRDFPRSHCHTHARPRRGSGKVDIVAGGYADWEAHKAPQNFPSPACGRGVPGVGSPVEEAASIAAPQPPPRKRGGGAASSPTKDQRELRDPARPHSRELETAIAKGEAILADPELYTRDPQRFATILSPGSPNARAERGRGRERWLMLARTGRGVGPCWRHMRHCPGTEKKPAPAPASTSP